MELGATVCLPNGAPLCDRCPAAGFCAALAQDKIDLLPVKAPKKARRVEERTVYLIFHEGRVALRRRPEKGLLAGLWEYTNEPAEKTDILEQWGIIPTSQQWGGTGQHIFTHIEWRMTARMVQAAGDTLPPGWVWADGPALRQTYAVPNAFQSFAPLVEAGLAGAETLT